MSMISGQRFFYQSPEGDGGGGGAPSGSGGGGAPAGATAGGGGQLFADANAARSFLVEHSAGDADFFKAVPDDKVMPWATRAKSVHEQRSKDFPGEWRNLLAGEDKAHLKTLETMASPKALYSSYAALRAKLAAGELKAVTPFPAQGSDVEKTQWRKDNGIPETVEGYQYAPAKGKVSDRDKETIGDLAKSAHAANMRPEHFQATVNWYLGEKQRANEVMREQDVEFQLTSEDELRAEWGAGYRENVNRISSFLDTAPKGVKEIVFGSRGPDGKPLGSHPQVLRWLVDLARQQNPAGIVLPSGGGNLGQSIDDEIKGIEKTMRENRSAYNKDAAKQQRYRDLLNARDKTKKKAA